MKYTIPLLLLSASLTTLPMTANAKKFKTKEAQCNYYEKKKEAAEERMRRGYRAGQYDKLEAKRKYWKNLYVDNCFDF